MGGGVGGGGGEMCGKYVTRETHLLAGCRYNISSGGIINDNGQSVIKTLSDICRVSIASDCSKYEKYGMCTYLLLFG